MPRESFGWRKAAASVLFDQFGEAFTAEAQKDYVRFWRRRSLGAMRQGKVPPYVWIKCGRLARLIRRGLANLNTGYRRRLGHQTAPGKIMVWLDAKLAGWQGKSVVYRYGFPWALETAKKRYETGPR